MCYLGLGLVFLLHCDTVVDVTVDVNNSTLERSRRKGVG